MGEYWLSPAMSPAEIIDRIASGRVATWEVVIPEGLTAARDRRAARRSRPRRRAGSSRPRSADPELARSLGIPARSLEGYLFPETYRLPRGESGAGRRARCSSSSSRRPGARSSRARRSAGLSMHEVVTLASIVEKETGAPDERPLIASVFANRLQRNMRLESDPTVIYGVAGFDGNLRRSDLDDTDERLQHLSALRAAPGPDRESGPRRAARGGGSRAEQDALLRVAQRRHARVLRHLPRARRRRRALPAPEGLALSDPALSARASTASGFRRSSTARSSSSARSATRGAASTRRCAPSTRRSASTWRGRAAARSSSTSRAGA